MKNLFSFLIITLFFLENIFAQDTTYQSDLSKNYRVDFAISDAPAFKILGKEPSNLMRPSSSDVISFISSNILNPSEISLPNSFAAEISPAMLIRRNKMTLSEFRNNYFLYNIRLSVGTTKDTKTNKYNLGIGLRSVIIDNGDLRKDTNYIDAVISVLDIREKYKNKLKDKFFEDSCKISEPGCENRLKRYLVTEMKKYDDTLKMNNLDKITNSFARDYWNKEKLEFACALLGVSPDSLSKNVELSKFSAWSTFAFPLLSWGQIFIGGNLDYNVLSKKGGGSLASRIYGGSNYIKGFLEAQYRKDNGEKSTNWLLNLGIELNLSKGFWLVYYAGYENSIINSESKSRFISQFDVRIGLQ